MSTLIKESNEINFKLCPPHKLVRSKSNKEVFRCAQPKCSYFHKKDFLEGKEAICSQCNRLYIVDAQQLRNAKPRCVMCQDTRKAKAIRKTIEKMNSLDKLANIPTSAEPEPIFSIELPTISEAELKEKTETLLLPKEENI